MKKKVISAILCAALVATMAACGSKAEEAASSAASAAEGVESVCCLYNAEKARITLFYTGPSDKAALTERLKEQLPEYMLPKRTVHLDRMPLNLNGKVDRQELKKQL